jgi:hypothetical protein
LTGVLQVVPRQFEVGLILQRLLARGGCFIVSTQLLSAASIRD